MTERVHFNAILSYNEKGIKVKYECAKSNFASVKIAEKCGLKYTGERYSYVCYAVDEEDG